MRIDLSGENSIFDVFEQQGVLLAQMAAELRVFLAGLDQAEERQVRIKELEHRTDDTTRGLMQALQTAWILDLDRDDVARIVNRLDDVADCIDAAALRLTLYRITEPQPGAEQLAVLLEEALATVRNALAGLRDRQRRALLNEQAVALRRIRGQGVEIQREALATLYNAPGTNPLVAMKWQEVYEWLGKALGQARDLAEAIAVVGQHHA